MENEGSMKTQSHKVFALFAFGLLLFFIVGANCLWIRHEQRRYTLVEQRLTRAQQQQKDAQDQVVRLNLTVQVLQREVSHA